MSLPSHVSLLLLSNQRPMKPWPGVDPKGVSAMDPLVRKQQQLMYSQSLLHPTARTPIRPNGVTDSVQWFESHGPRPTWTLLIPAPDCTLGQGRSLDGLSSESHVCRPIFILQGPAFPTGVPPTGGATCVSRPLQALCPSTRTLTVHTPKDSHQTRSPNARTPPTGAAAVPPLFPESSSTCDHQ